MKIFVIIVVFLISFTSSFAQNTLPIAQPIKADSNQIRNNPSPIPAISRNTIDTKKMSPYEKAQYDKLILQRTEFEKILKSLNKDQTQKFHKINQDYSINMMEYQKSLNSETLKISKLTNLLILNSYIFKGKNIDDFNKGNIPNEQKVFYQKQINDFEKLSPMQKTLIKKELIKFRKKINVLEKKRRQDLKNLLGKDLPIFKEKETEEQINNDDK